MTFEIAVTAARLLRWIDRHTDLRIDVSRAGRALLASQPDAVSRLSARLSGGSIVVSATNGKTTTTNLLAALLRANGATPVVNNIGANMSGGVAAELLARARVGGRMAADIGVFEVDELWLDHVVPDLQPNVIVLGNLFRDQLDRMGEIDRVAARWQALVDNLPDATTVVVNADDPRLCQMLAGRGRVVHYGIADVSAGAAPPATDPPDCRRCGGILTTDGAHIGHLGAWRCPTCQDHRPEQVDVEASNARSAGLDGTTFTVATTDTIANVTLPLPGRYNVANAVAATAAALAAGVPLTTIVTELGAAAGAFGRAESIPIGDRRVVLMLAKNPTSLDEIIGLMMETTDASPHHLVFLLNDREIDARDASWIWDADVERLAPHLASVTCGGARAAEMALRFDYAGVPGDRIVAIASIDDAITTGIRRSSGVLPIVANYSAMLDAREAFAEQGHAPRYWA